MSQTSLEQLNALIAASIEKGLVVSLADYDQQDGISADQEPLDTPNSLFYMMQDTFAQDDISDQVIMDCLVQQLPESLHHAIL